MILLLRAKVKKGVNILSTRTSEPRQWDVRQELGNGGKHATAAVVCQRLAPARNRIVETVVAGVLGAWLPDTGSPQSETAVRSSRTRLALSP
ncbi:hypothetical protein CB1_000764007, partial [Camelus ferus]